MIGKIIKCCILLGLAFVVYQLMGQSPTQKELQTLLDSKPATKEFKEGFEGIRTFSDLFESDASRWHSINLQNNELSFVRNTVKYCLVDPVSCLMPKESNALELEQNKKKRGRQSLKITAQPSTLGLGKNSRAALRKHNFDFAKGDTIYVSFWMYLEGRKGEITASDLLFAGFRSEPDSFRNRKEPGRFLYITDQENIASDVLFYLPKPEPIKQALIDRVRFPKNKWVKIEAEIELSDQSNGRVQVWQDEDRILYKNGRTLPSADTRLSIFELGVIGHQSDKEKQVLYIDNVEIREGAR